MDKVIIDGVDVSECSYAITPKRQCPNKPMPYAKETSCISCKEHNTKLNFCKNNPDCYFKQLKRLQAENEELKQLCDKKDELLNSTTRRGIELEQENERLKEENEQLKKLKFKSDGIELLQDANLNLHDANVKYRQALQEIRGIAEKMYNTNDEDDERDFYIKLQAKINEVIGAE